MGRKAEVQRIHLEKLMGPEAMGVVTQQLHFTDDKVCKNFLCGTCPHDLFSNTKVDLGTCPRSHNPRLKEEYTTAVTTKGERYPTFELEYEDNIRAFMADIDRKVAANKRRIEQTPEETQASTNLMRDIADLERALTDAMAEVERLGEAGEVEASLAELQKAEALKTEKAEREAELQKLSETAGASGHQKLRVCEVCGAYLSILDSDRRLADHFGGRMHLGYVKLREVIEEFDRRRQRNEDPRQLIAAGVGWRPPARTIGPPPTSAMPGGMPPRAMPGGAGGYANGHGSRSHGGYGPPPPSTSSGYDRYGGRAEEGYGRDRRDGRDSRDRDRYERRRSRSPTARGYR